MTIFDVILGFLLPIVIIVLVLAGFFTLYVGIDDIILRKERSSVGWTTLLYGLVVLALVFYLLLFVTPDFLKDVISRA